MALPPFMQAALGESIGSLPPDARVLVAFGAGLRELSQLFGVKHATGAEPSAKAMLQGNLGPIDALMLLSRLQGGAAPPPTPNLPLPGPMAAPPSPPLLPQPNIPLAGTDPRAMAFQRLLMGARGIV